MDIITYDGSMEGLLSAVFEVYEYKIPDPVICVRSAANGSLFGQFHEVHSNTEKTNRVYKKLSERLSKTSMLQVYSTFLSGLPGMENILLRYIQYVLASKQSVEYDYSHPDVLFVQQTSKKVHREKHRMEAFIRFQVTQDQLYYAIIQPDFNVLPLINNHFRRRYADQRWLIYDSHRKYGLYYDLETVTEIEMNFDIDVKHTKSVATLNDTNEELYQKLWQQYFSSVNIAARKNMKLHIQHMPKRYWRFLTEKQVQFNEEF
ncbi:MAG: TIGR03915 family putative DNA repair protein [Bacteroidota bacterium]